MRRNAKILGSEPQAQPGGRGRQALANRQVWLALMTLSTAFSVLPVYGISPWGLPLHAFEVAGAAAAESDLGVALGESSTAVNVRTRIGQPAPRFTLRDADGRRHAVTPGGGRKHVIIFHMGWT